MFENIHLEYSILLIKSIGKKSFQCLADLIGKSRSTISRILPSAEQNFESIKKIAQNFFHKKSDLILIFDDTLIKKTHSRFMRGSGMFYDSKIGRRIIAYRLLCSAITDGNYIFPLQCLYLFSPEFKPEIMQSKNDIVKQMYLYAKTIFPNKKLIIAADGAFATKETLTWCIKNQIPTEMRMAKNRTVWYKSEKQALSKISDLQPKGRQKARTIKAFWHDLPLFITAQKRTDKHGEETIVYQVSTYETKPSKHVAIYKKRWPIEKMFRTTKQSLGLQDCFSTKMDVQLNHVSSVFLAYTLLELQRKMQKFKTPEDVIRSLKLRSVPFLKQRINRLAGIFKGVYA
jgi:hypothetical protein